MTDKQAHEQRKLEQQWNDLRYYLALKRWSTEVALWVLVGLDPDSDEAEGQRSRWQWLPGGLREEWKDMNSFTLGKNVETEFEEVKAFVSGESRFPIEWIEHALNKRYTPPWLELAYNDPECLPYLPAKPRLRISSNFPLTPEYSERQRSIALKGVEKRPKSILMRKIRETDFEEWWKSCQKYSDAPYAPLRGERQKFAEKMEGKYQGLSSESIYNAVGKWIKEKKHQAGSM